MKNKTIKLIWLFIIGSFIGYILETLLTIYQGHYEVRKGLIYGGFIPVYGIGAMMYFIALANINFKTKHKTFHIIFVFLLTSILGGITEYLCSFFQEKCLGVVSWDYSYLKYHIAGRTSLKHCICWGVLGIIYYITIIPLLKKTDKILENKIKL